MPEPSPGAHQALPRNLEAPITSADGRAAMDRVTVEEPMEIRVAHGERAELLFSLSVTMRTPGDDFDLALGFLFTEGIIASSEEVLAIEPAGPRSPDKGWRNVVKVTLAPAIHLDTQNLTRHFFTTSSCGVCGKASLDAVRLRIPTRARQRFAIDEQSLKALPAALRQRQQEFGCTGGIHAAAVFDAEGRIHALREDVGRHNALDKLIGLDLAERKAPPLAAGGLLLSGRASFELVQKAAMTGVCLVAAIGSPSSLAIELAAEQGITLAGFLKATGFNLYTHPERVRLARL